MDVAGWRVEENKVRNGRLEDQVKDLVAVAEQRHRDPHGHDEQVSLEGILGTWFDVGTHDGSGQDPETLGNDQVDLATDMLISSQEWNGTV